MKRWLCLLLLPLLLGALIAPCAHARGRKALRAAGGLLKQNAKSAPKAVSAATGEQMTRMLVQAAEEEAAAQALRQKLLLPKPIRLSGLSLRPYALKLATQRAELGADAQALQELFKLHKKNAYYNKHLFFNFVTAYYRQRFGQLSPKMLALLHNAGAWRDWKKEVQLFSRLTFLSVHANDYLAYSAYLPKISNLRLHYMGIRTGTDYADNKLFYEYEIRARAQASFPAAPGKELTYFFNGPQKQFIAGWTPVKNQVSALYAQLLNLGPKEKPVILLQKKDRKLIIANQAKTRWIRISSHELANPNGLHIHLCWIHQTKAAGLPAQPVLINVSIPLTRPEGISDPDLFKLLVEQPTATLLKTYKIKPGNAADF